ncbi:hypothetical protein BcDW1_9120 [Botrytis cinerea BcDW1]|uniref:Uncharacterized protein n=1 Tax=Botryotinia fuckeliana (strain BcDW1) TaxID=1290391 RepID=M7UFG5_BOTF1|nr:hypothetical protein BcDW1_9120 [Botrytis cinerea BcDW1]
MSQTQISLQREERGLVHLSHKHGVLLQTLQSKSWTTRLLGVVPGWEKLQLFNAINGQPQTCKKIAQRYAAAARHKNIAETLIRRNKRSAALALTEQARAIKSSANIALPPKKLTSSEFWAAVVQAPADISTPSENHPGRESATSI